MSISAVSAQPSSRHGVPLPRGPLLCLTAWGLLAFGFSLSGILNPARLFLVPGLILGGVGLVLVFWRASPALRRFTREADLGWFMALHALRLPIGAMFLYELSRGRMNAEFALGAGLGDMAVGGLAAALLLLPSLRTHRTVWVVNAIGLLDILVVVSSGQRILFFGDPGTMPAFFEAPYPMLPSFIVPLVISSHLLMFERLRGKENQEQE